MNPKKIPFTDAYVKEQQSSLKLGYNLFAAIGAILVLFGAILTFLSRPVEGLITLGMIFLLWAALSKQRLSTFHENLELSKMIQQLRSAPEPGPQPKGKG
jgi:hypothetical protein